MALIHLLTYLIWMSKQEKDQDLGRQHLR